MKKSLYFLAALFVLVPVVYLLILYPTLPETVPTHFQMNGKPDGWSSKSGFLFIITGLSIFSYLIYLLLTNIHLIDPKRSAAENRGRLQKIGIAIVVFIAAIETWIIHITRTGSSGKEPRIVFIAVGILLAVIGNYMENIKPNYFAGLRLPWTLENEENWRKTHHYASRIWFAGGLIIAAASILLPFTLVIIVLFTATIIMVLLPAIYSYQLFKRNKQKFSS